MKIRIIIFFTCMVLLPNCQDYLAVVPDGVATLENAFTNRTNAEKFFHGCYNYLPNMESILNYPGFMGGDDRWWCPTQGGGWDDNGNGQRIARGLQNISNPLQNFWDGGNGGKNMWVGIRDCNIFLENIDQVANMQNWEKERWKAEVKILKAYFHFYLMTLYGPIPIMDSNIDVSAPPDEVKIFRAPVDDVVNYIVRTLNDALASDELPLKIDDITTEYGRLTKAAATAVRAKALVWAASPIFNGSYIYYRDFKDKRGVQLIADDNSAAAIRARWERAATAIKNAIDTCHLAGHALFEFYPGISVMSDTTVRKFTIRGAVSESVANYNNGVIWALNNGNGQFQTVQTPALYPTDGGEVARISATMKMAEMFYTRNGIPIDEDPYWDYENRYETQVNDTAVLGRWHRYYISEGETTAKLNYFREPRFYGNLGFDRGLYELVNIPEDETIVIRNRVGETHGRRLQDHYIVTGYFIKKMVSVRIPAPNTAVSGGATTPNPPRYSIPIIRLADLYLLYAEALNELKSQPDDEVYEWIDRIRTHAGLEGVVESWRWSSAPYRVTDRDEMREIIKRERLIELAFEGQRSFDLRRWLDAETYCNQPVRGWDYTGARPETYYLTTVYFNNRKFTYKDYLWPLSQSSLTINGNLVQNPGW
ncbi:MAG: RagB/SusD family nutrient uptake outer membrane protein [Bacteroidales bacterium]|nr:RagB/SusD family nutrient uptake outer membrane protein [Bacteroidales bacterium]